MKQDKLFYVCIAFILLLFFYAYANHFNNPFHFDDEHTIVSNKAIQSLDHFSRFFTDATTFSSLPSNQLLRPGVTILNAIDFKLGGANVPIPKQYHISIFISFCLLGVLLYFFFLKLLTITVEHKWNPYFALLGAAFFCLHTANAETINYIISRSDSFSTLMVVLTFVVYLYFENSRKYYWYLIPFIIGLLTKEPALMFLPILFVYHFLIENESQKSTLATFIYSIKKTIPVLLLAILYFAYIKAFSAPNQTHGGGLWYHYLPTQFYIQLCYWANFILPIHLSADTDLTLITNIMDSKIILGLLVIAALLFITIRLSKNATTKLISFGILWFYIALLPTSSFFPLAEVMNDHRTFFPYIGLVIVCISAGRWIVINYNTKLVHITLFVFSFLLLTAHTYGVRQRNIVWSTGENLWYDVTIKSPKNARGLMNYGNTQMAKGNYPVALDCYQRGLKLWPNYSYLHINMGVLNGAMGNAVEADKYFKSGIVLNNMNPEAYYYYANFLINQNRLPEATSNVNTGLQISKQHIGLNDLSEKIKIMSLQLEDQLLILEDQLSKNPTDIGYLNLSLRYYNMQKYELCVHAAEKALIVNPTFVEAYNNICAAYNQLNEYDKSIAAAKKGLAINPNYQLLKNNLAVALAAKTPQK